MNPAQQTSAPERASGQVEKTAYRILVLVNDEPMRRVMGRVLTRGGYHCSPASTVEEANTMLGERRFDLVVCDVRFPDGSGLDLIRRMQDAHPDTGVLVASGDGDPLVAEIAATRGAYGCLMKPFGHNELLIGVANALYRRRLELENRRYRDRLDRAIADRTAKLRASVESLERSRRALARSREEAIRRLSRAMELRDAETRGHVDRIGDMSAVLARKVGLEERLVELIRIASPMHDVGKMAIPDEILLKAGRLSEEERAEMERHAEIGYQLLSGSGSELLDLAATIALTHHERWDGTGYPGRLQGDEIPIEGRIVAVADVFDALTHDRMYRPALNAEDALEVMREGRGTHFDPAIVDAFLRDLGAMLNIGQGDTAGAPDGPALPDSRPAPGAPAAPHGP